LKALNTIIGIHLVVGILGFATPPFALAELADRSKPVNLDADKITVDELKKTQVFEGNVQLSQGTLVIRSDRMVVTQDVNGYQRGVATGGAEGLARFRQKREARNEYVEGEAERIEHDAQSEKSQFIGRAHVKNGRDEVRGPYIAFDSKSETYVVTNSSSGTANPNSKERVHAVIQPRNQDASAATQ